MQTEKSISRLDDLLGHRVQVIAFGASYLGVLKEVNYDQGFLVIHSHGQDVTLDLEFVDSFMEAEE
jgi:hypothetical protein